MIAMLPHFILDDTLSILENKTPLIAMMPFNEVNSMLNPSASSLYVMVGSSSTCLTKINDSIKITAVCFIPSTKMFPSLSIKLHYKTTTNNTAQ
jgi:hypothetical protein